MAERRDLKRWHTARQAKVRLAGQPEFVDCQIRDINFKGLQIYLHDKLPRDTYFKLDLILDGEFIIEVEAWVAWHKSINHVNGYGLYFNRVNDEDKEKIYQFVYRYFRNEVKERWWADIKEGGEPMRDRRLFERFGVQLPVRVLDTRNGKEYEVYTYDMSAKGVGFIGNDEIQPSTPLEMWVRVPDKGEPLYLRGEVAWCRLLEADKYKAGVDLERADLMGVSRCLRCR